MSTPQQNLATNPEVLAAPKAAAQAINQGDLVKASSNLVVPISGATDTVLGVSGDTSPVVSLGDQLTQISVLRRGVFFLFLTAGDTLNFDDAVYLTAAPQIVTSSSGGGATKIGRCRELAAVTGAAGNVTRVRVEVVVPLS